MAPHCAQPPAVQPRPESGVQGLGWLVTTRNLRNLEPSRPDSRILSDQEKTFY